MRINLLDVPSIDRTTKQVLARAINLYPYLVHAIDVYIICRDPAIYNNILTPIQVTDPHTGVTNTVSKLSISIDGTVYPIKAGSAGESPTNPITFERPNYNVKLVKGVTVGYLPTPDDAYVETPAEKDDSIGTRNIGTNIILDDYIPINIIVNDPALLEAKVYPYGGQGVDGTVYDGYGGVDSNTNAVEGFGGVKPNKYLESVVIVVQKSQFMDDLNNRDLGIGVQNYGIRY